MKKMNLNPNELVVKAGKATTPTSKLPVTLVLTNQNRIYLNETPYEDFKEISYFDRNIFKRDGVHLSACYPL